MANDKAGGAFGNALIGALEEAVAFERGDLPEVRVDRVEITARNARITPAPAYDAERIRAIRRGLSLSQAVFAEMLNVSASTVRAWEQGAREPDGPTRRLLQVAELHPDALTDAVYGTRATEYRAQGWPKMVAENRIPWGTPRPEGER
jgi:DNA-binding transcriptional regulator YiaG